MLESHEGRASADIITFPRSERDVTPHTETPSEHLRRALAMLEAAQAEQRAALDQWRDALAQLSASASHLHANLETYQARLDQIHRP